MAQSPQFSWEFALGVIHFLSLDRCVCVCVCACIIISHTEFSCSPKTVCALPVNLFLSYIQLPSWPTANLLTTSIVSFKKLIVRIINSAGFSDWFLFLISSHDDGLFLIYSTELFHYQNVPVYLFTYWSEYWHFQVVVIVINIRSIFIGRLMC